MARYHSHRLRPVAEVRAADTVVPIRTTSRVLHLAVHRAMTAMRLANRAMEVGLRRLRDDGVSIVYISHFLEEAREVAREAVERRPRSGVARSMLGRALAGEAAFDAALRWTEGPLVKLAEFGLVFLLAVHFFGGLRLLALENLPWSNRQKTFAALAVAVSFFVACGFLLRAV